MKNEQTESIRIWWKAGFYDYEIDGGVEITEDRWRELLEGQSSGYTIVTGDDGYPALIESGPQTLEEHRAALLDNINTYDGSPAVNSFRIGEAELWLDKATRSGLTILLDVEKAKGETVTTLWYGSEPPRAIEIGIDKAQNILAALGAYASDVFNVTQRHRVAAYGLKTIDEVEAYDHTAGYPERLHFEA